MYKLLKIGPLAVIAPVYYLIKIFGVLPIGYSYFKSENNVIKLKGFHGKIHSNIHGVRFHVSKCGTIFWIFQLTLHVWTFIGMSSLVARSLVSRKVIACSVDNYCTAISALVSHTAITPVVMILVGFRLKNIVCCMDKTAIQLLRYRYLRRLPVATFAVILFTFTLMTKTFVAVLLINLKYPFLYYMFFIAYACPVFLVHLINVMCLVSQHSYEDVNRELGELKNLKSKTERVFRLRSLMNDHWFLEDYIELVSKTFGSKLLLTILDIYIQLLLCLYYAIWDSIVHGLHDILLHGVLNIVILMGNLVYLCYRGHSTVKESRRVIYQLRHLRDLLYDDPVCQAISAGIVLTYFLVLIQFQIEGSKHTSAAMNISEVVTVKCKSWPCIIKDE